MSPSQAFWEAEREAEEKARIKKEDRVLKQWTRLIHGLRIRQRLQEQYGSKDKGKAGLVKDQAEPSVNDGKETPQEVADVVSSSTSNVSFEGFSHSLVPPGP